MEPTDRTGQPRRAPVNGIELAYETFGDRSNPPLVLVMGFASQMIYWSDELCDALARAGHFVVRFDNRDVGLSTHLDGVTPPTLKELLLRRATAPYSIDDMADDALGLCDALGLGPVHLVGASMGGFIAQAAALRRPDRLRSLTLIMTSTGSRRVGQPKVKLMTRMLKRREPSTREEAIAQTVETFRAIGSPGYEFDEARMRAVAERSYDRAYDPDGVNRQSAAILTQGNRTKALHGVKVPTLVIHGLDDPLVKASGGKALAEAIPGARFVGYPGMGHELPRPLWPAIVAEISALTASADGAARTPAG